MAYTKTTWVDRVVQYPNRYKDQSMTQYTFSKDPGTITQAGTPLNASYLNKVEGQYDAVKTELGLINGDLWTQMKTADATKRTYWDNKLDFSAYTASDILTKIKTVDGTGSGLDADFVRGYDIVNMVEKNSYDDYLRMIELYYTGHFSGVDISGMKTMTFDGFINTDSVNAPTTTAIVDTTLKQVSCKSKEVYVIPSAVSSTIPAGALVHMNDSADIYPWVDVADMIDNNLSTFAYKGCSTTTHPGAILDMGSVKQINGAKFYASNAYGSTPNQSIYCTAFSEDGVTWFGGGGNVQINLTASWVTLNFAIPVKARYMSIEGLYNSSTSKVLNLYEVEVSTQADTSVLTSKVKTMSFTTTKAFLYLSVYTPSDSTIVPIISANNGVNFESMTYISSRVDPLDSNFTEKKYEISFVNTGTNIITKYTLTPTSGYLTPIIKKYGLYLV